MTNQSSTAQLRAFGSRAEATRWLTERHGEMSLAFPLGMRKVPLALYLRRNLAAAMRVTVDSAGGQPW